MKTLIKQIAITISLIALTATAVGVSGLFLEWSLPKSLNIFVSGAVGLVISISIAISIHSKELLLRLIQVSLSALLILSAMNFSIDNLFYFGLSFNLLWIVSLYMSQSNRKNIHRIMMLLLLTATLVGFLLKANVIVYLVAAILLIYSFISLSIGEKNQST